MTVQPQKSSATPGVSLTCVELNRFRRLAQSKRRGGSTGLGFDGSQARQD